MAFEAVRPRLLRLSRGLRFVSGDRRSVAGSTDLTSCAWLMASDLFPVPNPALLAWAALILLRAAASDASPFVRVTRRRQRDLACAPTSRSATAHMRRSNRPTWELRIDLSRPARLVLSIPSRTPLMRFRPLQHTLAAPRVSFLRSVPGSGHSLDGSNAVPLDMADARVGRSILSLAASLRDARRIDKTQVPAVCDHPREGDRCNQITTLANDPAISSATAFDPPSRWVMHRRASSRGVPLPAGSARPGRIERPSLCRRGLALSLLVRRRSWGSTLRRFTPASGWTAISGWSGPTCRLCRIVRPD
jgi:hypothetical protein